MWHLSSPGDRTWEPQVFHNNFITKLFRLPDVLYLIKSIISYYMIVMLINNNLSLIYFTTYLYDAVFHLIVLVNVFHHILQTKKTFNEEGENQCKDKMIMDSDKPVWETLDRSSIWFKCRSNNWQMILTNSYLTDSKCTHSIFSV